MPPPRIAIPMPHSTDPEYAERSIPQYELAVKLAGGEPVRIPLDQPPAEIAKIMQGCDAVLLPGSKADVDPAKFGEPRSPHTAPADPRRDTVDFLLLEDAFTKRKPILGICYGLQSLNVYRSGSLIQHIPDFLPVELRTRVNHEAGKNVAVAHNVEIEKDSKLAEIVTGQHCLKVREGPKVQEGREARERPEIQDGREVREGHGFSRADTAGQEIRALAPEGNPVLPVNSSHHQSAATIGAELRVAARCQEDGIVEAIEGIFPDHFVLAVQWHPERSTDHDEASRNLFRALVKAAELWQKHP
jgi:putative glutamine amidotransferase